MHKLVCVTSGVRARTPILAAETIKINILIRISFPEPDSIITKPASGSSEAQSPLLAQSSFPALFPLSVLISIRKEIQLRNLPFLRALRGLVKHGHHEPPPHTRGQELKNVRHAESSRDGRYQLAQRKNTLGIMVICQTVWRPSGKTLYVTRVKRRVHPM
jgi:hypothetical protein